MKNETNMNIATEASKTIKALNQIGTRDAKREASALGEILGNWNRRRVGDSMLSGCTEAAKSRFAI